MVIAQDSGNRFTESHLALILARQEADHVSPARVMGPPFCHEYGTGWFLVAGRVVMVTDDGLLVNSAGPN
jgi:hypothetical protein